jgi:uncharacterized membrane protein YfcA
MTELSFIQLVAIAIIFAWSGFVRSGIGFGGALFTLPFLLLVLDDPLVFLPDHLNTFTVFCQHHSHW